MAGFPWRPTPWFRHHHFHHQKPVVAWPSAEISPWPQRPRVPVEIDLVGWDTHVGTCEQLLMIIKMVYIIIYHIYSYVLRHSPKMIKCLLCTACMTVYVYITMYPTISHMCWLNHQIISMLYCAYVHNMYIYNYIYIYIFIHHSIKLC